jgi:hypothetical protein
MNKSKQAEIVGRKVNAVKAKRMEWSRRKKEGRLAPGREREEGVLSTSLGEQAYIP